MFHLLSRDDEGTRVADDVRCQTGGILFEMTHMTKPTIFKLARWASFASVVLAGMAMLLYPGGTARDPSTSGYSFFQNFLSDLGTTVAWGGQPNYLSAFLFMASFTLLALALVGGSVAFVRLYSSSRHQRYLARTAGAAGVISCVGLIGAALTPANRFLAFHLKFALLALGAAQVASLLFALATARDDRFPRRVAVAWLAVTLVLAALFSMWWGPEITTDQGLTIQVTVQKMVAIAIVIIFIYQSHEADRVVTRNDG